MVALACRRARMEQKGSDGALSQGHNGLVVQWASIGGPTCLEGLDSKDMRRSGVQMEFDRCEDGRW